MALITLGTFGFLGIRSEIFAPCAVAVLKGQAIRLDTTGKWVLADATSAANAGKPYLASRDGVVNETISGIREGEVDMGATALDGVAFNGIIYLSDTPGQLADAAGTVSVPMGFVIPSHASPSGADRLLNLEQ